MKKTLLISELYPPKIGGSCQMMADRASFFGPGNLIVLTSLAEGSAEADAQAAYPILRRSMPWKGPKGFEWLGAVLAIVRHGLPVILKQQIRVIECARPLPEGVAGWALSLLTGRKLLVNFHGEDISVLKNYRAERWTLRFLIRSARLNLANSSFTQDLIREIGGEKARTAIVHPGFNPKPFSNMDPSAIQEVRKEIRGGPVLLTIGRLQRRKGQDQVVKALPQVVKRFPKVRYLAVGSAHGGTEGLGEELIQLAESLGVREHFELVGEVTFSRLSLYLAACDVFLMPNRTEGPGDVEGFGIVFLEAGFLGKPVIGGLSGGAPDAVQDGETGLLVDGDSTQNIADAILSLLENPDRCRKMGEAGKSWALRKTNREVFLDYAKARDRARL